MKKVLAFVLCLIMVAGVAACSDKKTAEFSVDVFLADFADSYVGEIRKAMEDKLAASGIAYNFHDAENDEEKQVEQVEEALDAGTHLVVVDQINASGGTASTDIIKLAKEHDVPAIFFNGEVSDTTINSYKGSIVFVGHIFKELGEMQGEMIAETLIADYQAYDRNNDGIITYVMLTTMEDGSAAVMSNTVNKVNELLEKEDIEPLAYYDEESTTRYIECNDKNKFAGEEMTKLLESNDPNGRQSPIELVITTGDAVALEVLASLQEAGYNTADGAGIPLFGFYATSEGIASVEAGELTGTIQRNPVAIGQTVADIILALSNGQAMADIIALYENVAKTVDKIRIEGTKIVK
jgi:hypothetical protein